MSDTPSSVPEKDVSCVVQTNINATPVNNAFENDEECPLPKRAKLTDENSTLMQINSNNESLPQSSDEQSKNDKSQITSQRDFFGKLASQENGDLTAIKSDKNSSEKRLCPSVVDRYFTKRYEVNLPKGYKEYQESKCTNFNDVCILRHTNKLNIITLAPSHPIIKNKDSISVTAVSYKVSDQLDHSQNQVSGKKKHGAHWLDPMTPVCIVTCSDGSTYTVRSGTRGKLLEINDQLLANPSLVQTAHVTNGYIAIVMPKLTEGSRALDELLTEDQYQEYLMSSELDSMS